MTDIHRRQFIKTGALATGTLVGSSLISMPLIQPAHALAGKNEPVFEESACGGNTKKILVGYESMFGSTSGVAARMADVLCEKGFSVDLMKLEHVKDLSSYNGAVIGSSVKGSAWLPSAVRFVSDNQEQLKKIPVFYFLTCLALYGNTEEAKATAHGYFHPVLTKVPRVRPVSAQAFAGTLDYSKMNMVFKMIMKSKMSKKGVPEGDFRNFELIRAWTLNTVYPHLV